MSFLSTHASSTNPRQEPATVLEICMNPETRKNPSACAPINTPERGPGGSATARGDPNVIPNPYDWGFHKQPVVATNERAN